ncbi:hypothetical protein EDD29_1585 [Actinocorallia herbida]|uniref:Uncharacterized protein n=1 Tax=Actinocorallia herbida TaxID=58109 RepID=A0A3N1CRZ0_9ACTN|nr:hypothetical protein [Actinocorallia herbida]ROO84073.1 hypothetical protein EDD29_1585 [Actinocorallia herbida]
MEDLEQLVASRLQALDGAEPSAEARDRVLGRVDRQVVVRRRRRRAAGSVAGASLVVAGGLALPSLLPNSGDGGATPPPIAIGTVEPGEKGGTSGGSGPDLGLGEFQGDGPGAETPPGAAGGFDRSLPTGKTLTVFGIGPDGTVLGMGVGPNGRSDRTLWRTDLSALLSAPVPIAKADGLYSATGSAEVTVWPKRTDDGFQLMCQGAQGDPVQLGTTGVARRASVGFHVDEGVVVWTDRSPGGRVWTARGCADEPSPLTEGYAAAFSYPYVYVLRPGEAGATGQGVHRVDMETGAAEDHDLPGATKATLYAAAKDTFAVADEGSLTLYDPETWAPRAVPDPLPEGEATLSAGDDVIAYTTSDESLVYDAADQTATPREGTAFANGPWLLTREGDSFQLAKTS